MIDIILITYIAFQCLFYGPFFISRAKKNPALPPEAKTASIKVGKISLIYNLSFLLITIMIKIFMPKYVLATFEILGGIFFLIFGLLFTELLKKKKSIKIILSISGIILIIGGFISLIAIYL